MWDIGRNEWDPLEGDEILEVVTLSLDGSNLEAIFFQGLWTKNDEIKTIYV